MTPEVLMPSPFPGMDAYLEHPLLWPELHQLFTGYLADNLREVLPGRYDVRLPERVFVEAREVEQPPPPAPGCVPPVQRESGHRNGRVTDASPDQFWNIPTAPAEMRET